MNAPDRMDAIRLPEGIAKITIVPDEKVPNAALFVVSREDHTVGNLMRMELLRDPRVKFSGYKHPHPLDNDIVFRVQTSAGVLPSAAFIAGANHLEQEFRTLQERLRSEIARVKADVEDFDRDEQI